MKIREVSNSLLPNAKDSEKDFKLSVNEKTNGHFLEELQKVRKGQMQQKLDNLLKAIEEQGQRFGRNRSIGELKRYKELVKRFVAEVVSKTYNLKQDIGWDRRGRHRVFQMIEKVDQALEELTAMIFDEQSEQIKILAKVDEIRGLLIDIYS